jgi:hypothetical protein
MWSICGSVCIASAGVDLRFALAGSFRLAQRTLLYNGFRLGPALVARGVICYHNPIWNGLMDSKIISQRSIRCVISDSNYKVKQIR